MFRDPLFECTPTFQHTLMFFPLPQTLIIPSEIKAPRKASQINLSYSDQNAKLPDLESDVTWDTILQSAEGSARRQVVTVLSRIIFIYTNYYLYKQIITEICIQIAAPPAI